MAERKQCTIRKLNLSADCFLCDNARLYFGGQQHVHAVRVANCLTIIGRPRGNSSSHVPNAESFQPARPVTNATTALASAESSMYARNAMENRGVTSSSRRGKRSKVRKRILCRFSSLYFALATARSRFGCQGCVREASGPHFGNTLRNRHQICGAR
jgi:hypothetical protein